MDKIAASREIDQDRHRFLGTATAAAITASFGLAGSGAARPRNVAPTAIDSASHTSFASLIDVNEAVNVVRPAVQKDHHGTILASGFSAADIQRARLDLLCLCWRQRAIA